MLQIRHWLKFLVLPCIFVSLRAHAQIDPVKRELIQLGYNQPIEGHSPISAYAFYYYNQPSFLRTNVTLRLAVAPVYVDSELGFKHLLGTETDLGIGAAGGGFADSYSEIRRGKLFQEESFTGHGGNISASIYHLFNPEQKIPLNAILRGALAYATYQRDDRTAPGFVLPEDRPTFFVRTGFRWGGREPLMISDAALELSVWYEGQFRLNSGPYGFGGDRRVNPSSHLFWGRALFAYTLPELKHSFALSITAGTSVDADRFSAYRLGGTLPLSSEFSLMLPGYYYQEISASRFALINGSYSLPLDKAKRWSVTAVASSAAVDYLPGLSQPGNWNSGVGGGITYRSFSEAWQVFLGYSHGFNAIRTDGRGANSVGFLVQFDLGRAKGNFYDPGDKTGFSRGLDRMLSTFP
ncbi:MAG: hypothetical protein JWQ71_792 [Pedosphaera sp.]|nr:hypothetical protein [Pedosphaera sp.]